MRFRYAEVVTNILNLAKGSYVGEWLESGQSLFPSKSKGMFGPRKCGGGKGGGRERKGKLQKEREKCPGLGWNIVNFLPSS